MNKKKAIKLATASVIAASSFAAVAPFSTQAAVDVAGAVNKAVAQMKKAQDTYTVPAAQGKLASKDAVKAEIKKADQLLADATKVVNSNGGSKKSAYLTQLNNAKIYLSNAKYFVQGMDVAQGLTVKARDFKKLSDVKDAYLPLTGAEIAKAEKQIRNLVAGTTAENLVVKIYLAEPKQISVVANAYSFAAQAAASIEKGDLKAAEAQLKVATTEIAKRPELTAGAARTAVEQYVKDVQAKYEAALAPVVESVSAINAKQVEVKFNKAIDATTVYDATTKALKNITVTGTGTPVFTGALSEDKKTLLLTADKGLTGEYVIDVATDKVKDLTGKFVHSYIGKISVNDETAPSIIGMVKENPTSVKINFSEPIKSEGSVSFKYTDGTDVTGAKFILDATGTFGTVDLSAGTVNELKDIKVQFIGATDFANNLLTPNPATVVVQKGQKDGVKPEVKALTVLAPNKFEIQFTEQVTDFDVSDITVNTTPLVVGTDKLDQSTTDATKYVVTLASPLEGVKTVAIAADAVKDNSGETGKAFSKLVEFTKDASAPQLSSATVSKNTTDGKEYLFLSFDKSVTLKDVDGIALSGSKLKDYITTSGLTVNLPKDKLVLVEGSTNTFKIALADVLEGSAALEKGAVYTLDLAADVVQNVSKVANVEKAKAITFTRGEDTNVSTPAAQTVTKVEKGTGNSQVVVTFGADVDGATATNAANYVFDGAVVEKAQILDASKKNVVTLTLKADSTTFSGLRNYTVSNVKTATGGTLANPARGTIDLTENVSPTVSSAVITSDSTIVLTFSEGIKDGAKAGLDFDVFQGTSTIALEETSEVISGNKVTITLKTPLQSLSGVKVKASTGLDVTDTNGNGVLFSDIATTN
ncbi:Ig-like domain-containing protein [Bacillaceae bacterium C204]|uniref:Ig-like domain-containing protein n=1 Tax=Neobacillus sp. 204 TaxID=3383351 RepID=UPI0039798C49